MTQPPVTPRAPKRDDIRQIVLDRITMGDFPAGTRINESKLAAELGVSRTPLREALLHLQRDGFVRAELARGFSVPPLSAREVREVYPIVEALEGLALRSITPIEAINTGELRRLNHELAQAAGDSKRCIAADTTWHATLLAHCRNQRLLTLIATLKQAILRYEHLYMIDASLVARSVRQHDDVIAAIEAGDVERAAAALHTNWLFSLDTLLLRIGVSF